MIASVLMMLAQPQQTPADAPPPGAGPRGTSQAFGAARYDAVGYASWYGEEASGVTASGQRFDPAAITAAHPSLPLGSFAEVTALDTGRTIVVLINDRGPQAPGRIIDLSRGAAQLLGIDARSVSAVRVRRAEPPAADQFALRNGRAASPRLSATPQLIAALRKQLPATRLAAAPPPQSPPPPRAATAVRRAPAATVPTPLAAPTTTGTLFVQVAAFSTKPRAQALAATLGGSVQDAGPVYRVRLGPFPNRSAALAARDGVARRGFGDARIVDN